MKIPKEYTLIIIAGLFILAYLLDALVDPLPVTYPTPYHYFNAGNMSKYAFSTISILIRAVSMILTPMWLFSFFRLHPAAKGGLYLVLGSLAQLYALQQIATNAKVIPVEWAMSLCFAGVVLMVPAVIFIIMGLLSPYTASPTDEI